VLEKVISAKRVTVRAATPDASDAPHTRVRSHSLTLDRFPVVCVLQLPEHLAYLARFANQSSRLLGGSFFAALKSPTHRTEVPL
jgi:hypothetical protein